MTSVAEAPEEQLETPTVHLRSLEDAEPAPLAAGTIYKCSIGVQTDNNLARDNIWVNPHFRDTTGASTPAQLAGRLAAGFGSWFGAPVRGTVKVYLEDFNPAAIHNPLAVADFGTVGTYATSSGPREIALCLSYYSNQNTKRYRGRLYIPHAWIRVAGGGASSAPPPRPTAQTMATAGSFYTTVLKSPEIDGFKWTLASTVDRVDRTVTAWWVDDEWDVVRSRGFRGTTRTTGTVP
jgi:hypothetical protein